MKNDYKYYLESKAWENTKKKAKLLWDCLPYCSIENCDKYYRDWHHYKGYEAIFTEDDYLYIAPVCRTHHYLCHNSILGKVKLIRRNLVKRYDSLSRQKWRRLRPSQLISWISTAYEIPPNREL